MEYFQTPSKKELAEGKRKHRLEEIAEEEQKKPKKYKAEVVPLQSYFQLLPKNILEEVRECARDDSVELVLDFTRYLSDIDGKKQSSLGYSAMFKNEIYRIALCFPSKKRSQLAHADLMKEYCELEEAEAKRGEPKPEERPRPSHVLTGKYLVGGQKKALVKSIYANGDLNMCRFCGRSIKQDHPVHALPVRWNKMLFSKPCGYSKNSGPAHSECLVARLKRLATWEPTVPEQPRRCRCEIHYVSISACMPVEQQSDVIPLLKTVLRFHETTWVDPEEYRAVSEQLKFVSQWWSGPLNERMQKEKEFVVANYTSDERALTHFTAMYPGLGQDIYRRLDMLEGEAEKKKMLIEAFFRRHKNRHSDSDLAFERVGSQVPDIQIAEFFRYTKDMMRYVRLDEVSRRFQAEKQLSAKNETFGIIRDALFGSKTSSKPLGADALGKFMDGLIFVCTDIAFSQWKCESFKDWEICNLIREARNYSNQEEKEAYYQ